MTSFWKNGFYPFISRPIVTRSLLAILSGVLLALAFPKFNISWIAWFALLPLMFVLFQPITLRSAFSYSLLFGAVFYSLLLYWVAGVMHKYGFFPLPLAILFAFGFAVYNGLFPALFGLLARKILTQNYLFQKRFIPSSLQIAILNSLLVSALWVAVEYWQTYMFSGFPWCLLGYSLVNYLGILQVTTLTGIYGISFIVCVINVLLAHALYQKKRQLFLGTAIILAVLLTSDFAFRAWLDQHIPGIGSNPAKVDPSEHRVALLQINIPQDTDWTQPVLDAWLDKLQQMLLGSQSDIAVMPENPAPFYYPEDSRFTERLEAMVRRSASTVIAGVVISCPNAQGRPGVFNSAATLAPDGRWVGRYDKQHLVPFGEYVPFRKYLSFAGKLTSEISDFTAGSDFSLTPINGNMAGILICYEAIFPDEVRKFPRRGAEVLINITNDGWYGDSSAPYQHFEMSRVRAIENRRYLIRAANTGISGVIDPFGRVTVQTKLNKQLVAHGSFEYRTDRTFYTRFGDIFARVCVLESMGFALFVFTRRKKD